MRVRPRTKTQRGKRKEFPHMKNCDIQKQIDERFPNTVFHITLECWRIPFLHREDRHCGTHTQNIRSCIESLRTRSMVKICHAKASVLWASGVNNIRVTCICDGSMHASVTVAAILQNVYHQRGYNSKGPYHIDPLPRPCWYCPECRNSVKKDTLMSVVAHDLILSEWQCQQT